MPSPGVLPLIQLCKIYRARWRLSVPNRKLALEMVPPIPNQALNLSHRYW